MIIYEICKKLCCNIKGFADVSTLYDIFNYSIVFMDSVLSICVCLC